MAVASEDRRRRLGRLGERLAAEHLQRRGYRISERNYRCRQGEIDLVAEEGGQLIFVEVRTRRGEAYGTPEESVGPAKRRKLLELAQAYLSERGCGDVPWRVDVVGVQLSPGGELREIRLTRNAVQV
jgi:putative endonuclease